MRNAHAVGVADQTPMEDSLFQKHIDVVKAEGGGNLELMCGDDFYPDRRVRQGDNIEGGSIQVPGTAARPVR